MTQIPLDGGNGVLVATLLLHESGEWIRGEMWMPVAQQSPQGYGSALTYARRYGLSALCGLASDDDDADAASAGSSRGQQARSPQRSGQPSQAASSPTGPAKAAADPRLFENFCDRVDRAETVAAVNTVAVETKRAADDRAITGDQLDTIKRAIANKRTLLTGQANGAAQ